MTGAGVWAAVDGMKTEKTISREANNGAQRQALSGMKMGGLMPHGPIDGCHTSLELKKDRLWDEPYDGLTSTRGSGSMLILCQSALENFPRGFNNGYGHLGTWVAEIWMN